MRDVETTTTPEPQTTTTEPQTTTTEQRTTTIAEPATTTLTEVVVTETLTTEPVTANAPITRSGSLTSASTDKADGMLICYVIMLRY